MKKLLFATTYVDTVEKLKLLTMWLDRAMLDECDIMLIDSASPLFPYVPRKVKFFSFTDNVGHLSRRGRDGWGRAFCMGLDTALEQGYDYVAHVEGDSLLLPPVAPVFAEMRTKNLDVMSTHVSSQPSWMETGLMLFSCGWLRRIEFTKRYDWEHRARYPEPERVVGDIVKGAHYASLPWRGMRDDFKELTVDNLAARGLDWLTHAPLNVMERFAA